MRTKAHELLDGNNFPAAETEYEALMKCNDPGALTMAYMAACHAHKFDDAKEPLQAASAAWTRTSTGRSASTMAWIPVSKAALDAWAVRGRLFDLTVRLV